MAFLLQPYHNTLDLTDKGKQPFFIEAYEGFNEKNSFGWKQKLLKLHKTNRYRVQKIQGHRECRDSNRMGDKNNFNGTLKYTPVDVTCSC